MSKITDHEGSKYLRGIRSALNPEEHIQVDVYAVLIAFNITCPARAHSIKKLLCAGLRDKGSESEDLQGALAALYRAIELQKTKEILSKESEK